MYNKPFSKLAYKFIAALLLCCISFSGNAQNKNGYVEGFFMDYIVNKDGDTIYGAIQSQGIYTWLLQPNPDYDKTNDKFIKHRFRGVKSYRLNGFITNGLIKEDGVYDSQQILNATDGNQDDYVVMTDGDTIFGNVHRPIIGSKYIVKKDGGKIKFKENTVIAFKDGEFVYELWEKEKLNILDGKKSYLVLLYKGKEITLYGYRDGARPCYYIYKDAKLYRLKLEDGWANTLELLFADNPATLNLFRYGFLIYDNIYLAVRYYDEHPVKKVAL